MSYRSELENLLIQNALNKTRAERIPILEMIASRSKFKQKYRRRLPNMPFKPKIIEEFEEDAILEFIRKSMLKQAKYLSIRRSKKKLFKKRIKAIEKGTAKRKFRPLSLSVKLERAIHKQRFKKLTRKERKKRRTAFALLTLEELRRAGLTETEVQAELERRREKAEKLAARLAARPALPALAPPVGFPPRPIAFPPGPPAGPPPRGPPGPPRAPTRALPILPRLPPEEEEEEIMGEMIRQRIAEGVSGEEVLEARQQLLQEGRVSPAPIPRRFPPVPIRQETFLEPSPILERQLEGVLEEPERREIFRRVRGPERQVIFSRPQPITEAELERLSPRELQQLVEHERRLREEAEQVLIETEAERIRRQIELPGETLEEELARVTAERLEARRLGEDIEATTARIEAQIERSRRQREEVERMLGLPEEEMEEELARVTAERLEAHRLGEEVEESTARIEAQLEMSRRQREEGERVLGLGLISGKYDKETVKAFNEQLDQQVDLFRMERERRARVHERPIESIAAEALERSGRKPNKYIAAIKKVKKAYPHISSKEALKGGHKGERESFGQGGKKYKVKSEIRGAASRKAALTNPWIIHLKKVMPGLKKLYHGKPHKFIMAKVKETYKPVKKDKKKDKKKGGDILPALMVAAGKKKKKRSSKYMKHLKKIQKKYRHLTIEQCKLISDKTYKNPGAMKKMKKLMKGGDFYGM